MQHFTYGVYFFLTLLVLDASAQTASISGRITREGRPAPNLRVEVQDRAIYKPPDRAAAARREQQIGIPLTDYDGRYTITGLSAGTFVLSIKLQGFILEDGGSETSYSHKRVITVRDDEFLNGVDFHFIRGGVLMGRVVASSGKLAIERRVRLIAVDARGQRLPDASRFSLDSYQTDDRGVYRAYGLPAGHYLILVEALERSDGSQAPLDDAPVYYPGTIDAQAAKVVTVVHGEELANLDIRLSEEKGRYRASGRVIEDGTGKPIPGLPIKCRKTWDNENLLSLHCGQTVTDQDGKFSFMDLLPGKYRTIIEGDVGLLLNRPFPYYFDSRTFEILSENIEGVDLTAKHGAVIHGVAALETDVDPALASRFSKTLLTALTWSDEAGGETDVAAIPQPNGSFQFLGIRPGRLRFKSGPLFDAYPFWITRIERQGEPFGPGYMIRDREELGGLRIYFARSDCSIFGRVESSKEGEGNFPGEVLYRREQSDDDSFTSKTVDQEGRFYIEDLLPGAYTLRLISRSQQAVNNQDVSEPETLVEQQITLLPGAKKKNHTEI